MSEKEYIERGAVLDQMMFEMVGTGVQGKAMDVIRYAPAADVVAVVRCKDCVHYMPLPEQYNYSGKPAMHCAWHSRTMNENGYCDEARRKENDMARYINAEQMKGDIKIAMANQQSKDPHNLLPTHLAELLCQFVDDTPTADVVEVVRCKDCKHSVRYGCKNDACYRFMFCHRRDSYSDGVEEDDFCSYGERKEQT